tara:strand:+ start:1715 stop:2566 length:852 start_codon:yes stop_codon:yes gene_type:complete
MDIKKIITNWDTLTDQQKKEAENQVKKDPELNPEPILHPAAKFFEEHRWVKIDKFVPEDMCNLLYHHIQLEALRLSHYDDENIPYDEAVDGSFTDTQAPGDFSKYGDPIMDTLLSLSLSQMQTLTGKQLTPTYSYHRLYTTGTELKRHRDRPSCEISTTICLGADSSNVDTNTYPDWDWPIFVKEKNGKELPIHMKPGDMIIYRGCELEHWREPYWGKNHAQVFLHYNERGGKYDIAFDGRPVLGMPSTMRKSDSVDKNLKLSYDYKNKTQDKVVDTSKKIIY